jgi:hypothetical protein
MWPVKETSREGSIKTRKDWEAVEDKPDGQPKG